MASPFDDLATALEQTAELTAVGAKVFAHAAGLAKQGAPYRIVLLPASGIYESPDDSDAALRKAKTTIEAHLWADDGEKLWDLHQRLLQALEAQAHGGDEEDDPAGDFYTPVDFSFPTTPDTAKKGEAMTVRFVIDLAMAKATPLGRGRVDAYQLTRG